MSYITELCKRLVTSAPSNTSRSPPILCAIQVQHSAAHRKDVAEANGLPYGAVAADELVNVPPHRRRDLILCADQKVKKRVLATQKKSRALSAAAIRNSQVCVAGFVPRNLHLAQTRQPVADCKFMAEVREGLCEVVPPIRLSYKRCDICDIALEPRWVQNRRQAQAKHCHEHQDID